MKEDVSLNQRNERERLRLLEFQLDYLRAELLHLTHERYKMTYSVSGHIYRFLRPIEARVASWLGLEKNLSEEINNKLLFTNANPKLALEILLINI